jgi:hypothetical protein
MSGITALNLTERATMAETNGNGRRWAEPDFLVKVVAYVVVIALAYAALSERITRLEVQTEAMREAVGEIQKDVKTLLRDPR